MVKLKPTNIVRIDIQIVPLLDALLKQLHLLWTELLIVTRVILTSGVIVITGNDVGLMITGVILGLMTTGVILGLMTTGVILGLMTTGVILGPMVTGDVDGISIGWVHTADLESSHDIHWYNSFQPCFGEKSIEVELCDDLSRFCLKKLMAHAAPVPFQWPKYATVERLGFMRWQAKHDYSMISGKAHNIRLVVSAMSIE